MNSKIKVILGTVVFFLLFLGALTYFSLRRFETNTAWIDHSHRVIHSLQLVYADLKDAQTNYAEFLLTHKPQYASACRSDLDSLTDQLKQANDMVTNDTVLLKNMSRLQSLVEKKATSMQVGLAYSKAGRPDLAVNSLQAPDEKKADAEIKDLVNQMSGLQIWLLRTRKTFEEAGFRKNMQFMVFGSLSAFLICVLAAYMVNRQIRERQAVLQRLKDSEEKFRFTAETANDAFITTDAKGIITGANPAGEGFFGYPKQELIGRPFSHLLSERFTQDHGTNPFGDFVALTAGGKNLEVDGRRKDGTCFPAEVSLSHWQNREGLFYNAIIRDITERKFFVKTLLNNEHRLFQFLEAVPMAVLVRDVLGRPYYVNEAAKEIFGFDTVNRQVPVEEISQAHHLYIAGTNEPYPNDHLPTVKALAGEKSHVADIEMRRHNKMVTLEAWGTPILDSNKKVRFALVAVMDISPQKEITESLKEREEFFRNLFEEGPIGMTLAFPSGEYVNVNRAFSDMLGYSKQELIGRNFMDITYPEDAEKEKNLTGKLFSKILPKFQLEKRFITKKGDQIWCKMTASTIRDLENEPLFRLAIIENISEQKESEQALKESEAKFRALAESANDAIVSADATGLVFFFNPSAERVFECSSDDALGRPLHLLMSEKSWKINQALIREKLSPERGTVSGQTLELIARRKNGVEFPAEISFFPWKTPAGLYFTAIIRDITERRQVEDMKNDLISVVSHQLKTPVAEINGYIENMLEGLTGELTLKQREYLTEMMGIGMENYRLISDLLSVSKIERGVLTVDPGPVSLQDLVESAIRDYQRQIQKKGLDLALEIGGPEVMVEADREKTVETLRNLVNNAVKCTDRGSITLKAYPNGNYGVIEVKDTGIGMSPETMKKLFGKERVLGAEASRSGAGLGLFIAKKFMEAQKGDITVSSELGKGSLFSVKIPKVKG